MHVWVGSLNTARIKDNRRISAIQSKSSRYMKWSTKGERDRETDWCWVTLDFKLISETLWSGFFLYVLLLKQQGGKDKSRQAVDTPAAKGALRGGINNNTNKPHCSLAVCSIRREPVGSSWVWSLSQLRHKETQCTFRQTGPLWNCGPSAPLHALLQPESVFKCTYLIKYLNHISKCSFWKRNVWDPRLNMFCLNQCCCSCCFLLPWCYIILRTKQTGKRFNSEGDKRRSCSPFILHSVCVCFCINGEGKCSAGTLELL